LFLVKIPDFSGVYVTDAASVDAVVVVIGAVAVVVIVGGTQKVSTFAVGWYLRDFVPSGTVSAMP
jgi:hypothetical protein